MSPSPLSFTITAKQVRGHVTFGYRTIFLLVDERTFYEKLFVTYCR